MSANIHFQPHQNFKKAIRGIALGLFTALIAQNVYQFLLGQDLNVYIQMAIPFLFIMMATALIWSKVWTQLDAPFFAISIIIIAAIGTAIGTFITQNTTTEIFTQRYGDIGSKILRFLNFDDVFHSWWFVSIFIMLSLSLIKMSSKRKFNIGNLGFHLAHLSPIVILAGFWIDFFYGFRGIIPLEVGQKTNEVQKYKKNTSLPGDIVTLDFSLQLDNFEFEKFAPDYRIQIWEMSDQETGGLSGTANAEGGLPRIMASLPLEINEIQHIYGSEYYFRLLEFYPNFIFKYTYPDNTDTIAPVDPGLILNLKTQLGERMIQMRSAQEGRNRLSDPHLGVQIEFYWNKDLELLQDLQQERIIIWGENEEITTINSGIISDKPLILNQYYPIKEDTVGFTIEKIFPDDEFLTAGPSSKNNLLENPVAKIDYWNRNWSNSRQAYLYPSRERKGGILTIPNSKYFLALESIKDRETKFWKSQLSIVDNQGKKVKEASVIVNEPLLHNGYRFYQSDFDPNNPKYSGIGVSHEPGLYIIYLGFILLFGGCLLMFFMRNLGLSTYIKHPIDTIS